MTANRSPFDVASTLWTDAGGPTQTLGSLSLTGADAVLPSIFRVGTAAITTIAGAVLATAEIAHHRTRRRPTVTVGGRESAVAFRSERYLRIDGQPVPNPWDPISGYYRCGDDRWVQLHCNFPHHRDGVLDHFGLPADRSQLEAAIAERAAPDVESELAAKGLCVAMMRSRDEWRAGPGAPLGDQPLVQISRIGDAPPRPLRAGSGGPLSGLRVLDLTRVLAGPICSRFLASHGADVMRVGASRLPTIGTLLADTNLGKRWADIDLKSGEGTAALRALEHDADLFIQGYRPGAINDLGFGPEAVAERQPGIVYVSISAFGHDSPWAPRRGFDSLTQMASGIAEEAARAKGLDGPVPLPCQALDHGTGYLAAMGALLARRRVALEGGSWHVQVSLARTGWWLDDLGRVPGGFDHPDPTAADVAELLVSSSSTTGPTRHAPPPGQLDASPGRWVLPAPTKPNSAARW